MGSNLSHEEKAIIKLFQHFLSKRGIEYDPDVLRRLLFWAKETGVVKEAQDVFQTEVWERIGENLWEELSSGKKDIVPFATLWKILKETIAEMHAEKAVTVPACAAFSGATDPTAPPKTPQEPPQRKVRMFDNQIPMSAPMPTQIPWEPQGPPLTVTPDQGTQPKEWPALPLLSAPPPPLKNSDPEDETDIKSDLYPPLPPTPPTCVSKGVEDWTEWNKQLDQRLKDLQSRLSNLMSKTEEKEKVTDSAQVPFPPELSFPSVPVPAENPVTMRWKEVIKDAMLDGVVSPLQAFPVITGPQGQRSWQPLDWKAIKEIKAAITQYGLVSTYTQQMLSALYSSMMLTPNDSHRVASVLLLPSQLLHFKSAFEELAD